MPVAPRVAVVVVTSNHREVIGAMLHAFERSEEGVSVTVIDQGSSDQTTSWLRESFPSVTGFRNFHDVGMARALNQGVAFALSKWAPSDLPYRYIALTVPDAVWHEEAIAACARAMDADSSIMAVSPLVLERSVVDPDCEDDLLSDKIISAGMERTSRGRLLERRHGELVDTFPAMEDVWCGSSRAVMIRASAFALCEEGERVWFDERLPNVFAAPDFLWRMHARGLRSVCCSAARVSVRSASDASTASAREVHDAMGWRMMWWKNESFWQRWRHPMAMVSACALEGLRSVRHPSRWVGALRAWRWRVAIARGRRRMIQ